jgi:hypothetical protein
MPKGPTNADCFRVSKSGILRNGPARSSPHCRRDEAPFDWQNLCHARTINRGRAFHSLGTTTTTRAVSEPRSGGCSYSTSNPAVARSSTLTVLPSWIRRARILLRRLPRVIPNIRDAWDWFPRVWRSTRVRRYRSIISTEAVYMSVDPFCRHSSTKGRRSLAGVS